MYYSYCYPLWREKLFPCLNKTEDKYINSFAMRVLANGAVRELMNILGGDVPPSFAPLDSAAITVMENAVRSKDLERIKKLLVAYSRKINAYTHPQDVIFLGDSTIDLWKRDLNRDIIAKLFPRQSIGIMGFQGDTTSDLLWRIENGLLHFQGGASEIFLHIGTNDSEIPLFYRKRSIRREKSRKSRPPGETVNLIKLAIDRIEKCCPQARIHLHLILPRGKDSSDPCRVLIDEVNQLLSQSTWSENIKILDFGKYFTNDKSELLDISKDCVHYDANGYAIWGEALSVWLGEISGHLE